MRYIYLIFSLIFFVSVASARKLTPEEAYSRLGGSFASRATPTTHTVNSSNNEPVAYIFNLSDRTIIASAEEQSVPILGILDRPLSETDSLPQAMRHWLEELSNQSATVSGHKSEPNTETRSREPIAPLLRSTWGQDYPYNAMCPLVGENHCRTGCVATAMAQIMYYHRWPEQGSGYVKYYDYLLGQEHEMDLNVKFDWDIMLPKYEGITHDPLTPQEQAVALLMKACGYSSEMYYSFAESGAGLSAAADALKKYFSYNDKCYYIRNLGFPSDGWEEIIYSNLRDCGPLLFEGSDSKANSHAFVCDGYTEDNEGRAMFHFDWGWGGSGNGYFRLSSLTADAISDYSFSQGAVLGIAPNTVDIPDQSVVFSEGISALVDYCSPTNLFFNLSPQIFSSNVNNDILIGTVIEHLDLDPVKTDTITSTSLYPCYVAIPELPDGRYLISALWKFADNDASEFKEIVFAPGRPKAFTLEIKDGEAVVINHNALDPTCVEFTFDSPLYFSKPYAVTVVLRNDHDSELFTSPTIRLDNPNLEGGRTLFISLPSNITLKPGESVTLHNFVRTFEPKDQTIYTSEGDSIVLSAPIGNYTVRLSGRYDYGTNEFIDLIEPFEVYIGEAPAETPRLEVSDFVCDYSSDHIIARFKVKCTQGYFASKIISDFKFVLTDAFGSISGWTFSDPIYLMEGEQTDCVIDYSHTLDFFRKQGGKEARLRFSLSYDPNADLERYDPSACIVLMAYRGFNYTSGIDTISDNNEICTTDTDGNISCRGAKFSISDLNGRLLCSDVNSFRLPRHGVYIIRIKEKSYKIFY